MTTSDGGREALGLEDAKEAAQKGNAPKKKKNASGWGFESWSHHRRRMDHEKYPSPMEETAEGVKYYAPSEEMLGLLFNESLREREARFPGVEERIAHAMGSFYGLESLNLVGEEFRASHWGPYTNSFYLIQSGQHD